MEKEKGSKVTRVEVFITAHKKKDDTPINAEVADKIVRRTFVKWNFT